MTYRPIAGILGALLVVSVPVSAIAHGSMKPSHGGVVQISGETMVELAKTAKGVDIYVSEEDEPLPAANFSAALIITPTSGEKYRKSMTPLAGNKFTAPGVKLASGDKVVVALTEKASQAKVFVTFKM